MTEPYVSFPLGVRLYADMARRRGLFSSREGPAERKLEPYQPEPSGCTDHPVLTLCYRPSHWPLHALVIWHRRIRIRIPGDNCATENAIRNSNYWLPPTATYHLPSRCFYLPNIALNGGTYDEFTANDIKRCCIACAKDHCCLGYSYSKSQKRCFMKSAVSDSTINYDVTRQGAFLRNIVIEGGAAAAVRLRKSEECQQYCTVYGIYSWSPPNPEDENDDGHCACMTRIQSLEYSFGSQSAIFPPVSSLN
ncbi:unnamed protein product [Toxocara canis]|uniref:Apple domain-containing protein n=1 Tax=Toxocara canis TaxID=6265 RepID=A0A183URQ0_TOXCA|nr:unnamed protein product [Toxocara canis]